MHNTGSIDSIATVIFMAGDERYACENSSFLFHGVAVGPINERCTLNRINEIQSSLKEDQNKIAGIISSNCDLKKTDIKELFRQGETKNLDFAKSNNIITDIKPANIMDKTKLITINLPPTIR